MTNGTLFQNKIINIMKHYVPVRLTTSRYNLPWFNKDLKKCAKERNDYIRKQNYLEIQKTGKSFVTSGKTCTNTALGNQFKSVFTHEVNSKLPNLNDSPHGKILKLTISLKGVHDQLSQINTSKSQGPDGIPPWFLNRYASHLTPIIHDIFQSSSI